MFVLSEATRTHRHTFVAKVAHIFACLQHLGTVDNGEDISLGFMEKCAKK